jgi:hypothetical protein
MHLWFRLPVDLEVWLLLGYVAVVLTGARITETVARAHFRRASRYAEEGFRYDADADHYHCPHGERLSLHVIDTDERVAVYRAPASSCAGCPSKGICTPHESGRHIYRRLADWVETDVGRFHQWLSLFMAASAAALSLVGLVYWGGQPGTGMLALALVAALAVVLRDGQAAWNASFTPLSNGRQSDD